MVLEKENAVLGNRELMGATKPEDAAEGTIRKNMEFLLIKILYMVLIVLKMLKIEIDFSLKIN